MLERLEKYKYIHRQSKEISEFAEEMSKGEVNLEQIIKNIFR